VKKFIIFGLLIIVVAWLPLYMGSWDNTLPADSTAWNDAAGYIRDNWDAIEDNFVCMETTYAGATLASAVSSISTTETTLIITGSEAVTDDLTIPATLTLRFERGGELNISSTKTVTINGYVEAGNYQIFTGSGVVSGLGKNDYLKPQWWGAVGDGVTDDTAEIQAAIDAAEAAGGGIVYFPPGTYTITSAITNDGLGVVLKGASRSSSIIYQSGTDSEDCLVVDASAPAGHQFRSGISDLTLLGNEDSGVGLTLTNGYEYTIERVTVRSHGGNGIDIGGYIYYSTLRDVEVWLNGGHGVRFYNTGGNDPHANTIVNMNCISNGDAGLYLDHCTDLSIFGGSFQASGDYGIECVTAHSVRLRGGWFEANGTAAIYCPQGSYGCHFEPGYLLDPVDLRGSNTVIYMPRAGAYGDFIESTVSNNMAGALVSNQHTPWGNTVVLAAIQGNTGATAAVAADARAILNGQCVELSAQNDTLSYWSGAYTDVPATMRPGSYLVYVYAKASEGEASNLQVLCGQTTNADGRLLSTITVGATDTFDRYYVGYWSITDTNYNGRALQVQLTKLLDDSDTISISHIVIDPIGPRLVAGQDGVEQGRIIAWDGAGGALPGWLAVASPDGTLWYLFAEDDGTLKIHNAAPTANANGSAVGDQSD